MHLQQLARVGEESRQKRLVLVLRKWRQLVKAEINACTASGTLGLTKAREDENDAGELHF